MGEWVVWLGVVCMPVEIGNRAGASEEAAACGEGAAASTTAGTGCEAKSAYAFRIRLVLCRH